MLCGKSAQIIIGNIKGLNSKNRKNTLVVGASKLSSEIMSQVAKLEIANQEIEAFERDGVICLRGLFDDSNSHFGKNRNLVLCQK